MSIIPDHRLLALGESLVYPFKPDNVQSASIDLTLGQEFIVFDCNDVRVVDLHDRDSFPNGRKVKIESGREFVLHTGQFILSATKEIVKLPGTIAGRLEGKSSLARTGLIIHATGGFIDPGFCGPITLEMTNIFPAPIILYPGDLICQVSFQYLAAPASNPYNGRYQNAAGVETSKFGIAGYPTPGSTREAYDFKRIGHQRVNK